MRYYQKVHDDIRAGRTELAWFTGGLVFLDAYIDRDSFLSISKLSMGVTVIFRKRSSGTIAENKDHPISKKIELLGEKQKGFWTKIAPTLEETKTKLQQLYNDYLLEEARKKDEQGYFQRKEVVK